MPTRRQLLAWGALAPLGVAIARRTAWAGPAAGAVLDATTRQPLTVVKTGVFSIANANDRYVATAELTTQPTEGPLLALGAEVLTSRSWGSGYGTGAGACHWEVDRATADRIAAAWKVTRADRVPLGAGLRVAWRARHQPFRRGKPMIVIATVTNTAPTPVGVQLGGRQYGRDEHFAFTATRNGKPLPVIPLGPAAGGGTFVYRALGPGDQVDVDVDLGGWLRLTRPGTYQLGCTYLTELVPGTASPRWPEHGAETWDLALTGPLTVKVA